MALTKSQEICNEIIMHSKLMTEARAKSILCNATTNLDDRDTLIQIAAACLYLTREGM